MDGLGERDEDLLGMMGEADRLEKEDEVEDRSPVPANQPSDNPKLNPKPPDQAVL